MRLYLLSVLILFSNVKGHAALESFISAPADKNSVGCGIIKGRLQYLNKTHSEVNGQIPQSNTAEGLQLLKILAQRYPESYREDHGYKIKVTWDLNDAALDLANFQLTYPGMIWKTNLGHTPEHVTLTQTDKVLILETQINSFDFCLDPGNLILKVADKTHPGENAEFDATWTPALILESTAE